MDLLELAQALLAKAETLTTRSALSNSEVFSLREEVRADAISIANAVDGPEQAMRAIARGYTACTALKVSVDLDLAHQLPRASSRSLEELAASSGCDKLVLRPVLRRLAQSGIFQQAEDGGWKHTEMSIVMTMPPFCAWLTSILEEKYRAVAHLPRFLKQTGYRFPEPGHTAYNAIYSTPLDFYAYSSQFDQDAALNFAHSMEELARDQLPFFEASYPLDRLESNSHFVDVAGGLGNLSYFLAAKLPEATFEVQDHAYVAEQAERACPVPLRHRIRFMVHDMLSPQLSISRPNKSRLVFLLKIILHDHSDADCKLILRNMLAVMGEGDRILVIDTVIPEVGGSLSSSCSDLIILSMFGTGHRTMREFRALLDECEENLIIETFTGGPEEFDGMVVIEIRKGLSNE